jgi:hypothetical protein
MSTLILGIDSGLKGAFVWIKDGAVTHTLMTATMVKDGKLGSLDALGRFPVSGSERPVAYIEQPVRMRGKGEKGIETAFINTGRVEERLRMLGYRIVRVLPKTWQGDLLNLDSFEVRTEVKCKPRLAEGWKLAKAIGLPTGWWRLTMPDGSKCRLQGETRKEMLGFIAQAWPQALLTTKTTITHDTKAASLAYVREHFPTLNLIPPRARNPHDGLADAVCIAVWGSRQIKETP